MLIATYILPGFLAGTRLIVLLPSDYWCYKAAVIATIEYRIETRKVIGNGWLGNGFVNIVNLPVPPDFRGTSG
jgi:hypothetical protein